jgi:hypothetical protein
MENKTFTPLRPLNSPSLRIPYFGYTLGEFFPKTHLISVIELDGHTVLWHEMSHRMLTSFCPVHDSGLELYFAELTGNTSKFDEELDKIEQYRELLEGHASAMVKLAHEFRGEDAALIKILEKKRGYPFHKDPLGHQIAIDLERISRKINPKNPIDACQSVSNVLGGVSSKDDVPAYKEALSWLKGHEHMFRGLSSFNLSRMFAKELEKEGFTALGPYYGCSALHIRIMVAMLHYLHFLSLVRTRKDSMLLVPILIPLLNSVMADWGPSIVIFISKDELRISCRFPLDDYKVPLIKRHCLVSNQVADLYTKCSALKEKNMPAMEKLKTYFFYYWETLAQVENLWLSTPDCEECTMMLKEGMETPQGTLQIDLKDKPISKSEKIFRGVIELYEPWIKDHAPETAKDFHPIISVP